MTLPARARVPGPPPAVTCAPEALVACREPLREKRHKRWAALSPVPVELEPLATRCADGHTDACRELSRTYQIGIHGVVANRDKAIAFGARGLRPGCDSGDAASCYSLAMLYNANDGDRDRARSLYARACTLGHRIACGDAALLAEPRFPCCAQRLKQAWCDLGSTEGCSAVRRARDGDPIVARKIELIDLLASICALGEPSGCTNLAACAVGGRCDAVQTGAILRSVCVTQPESIACKLAPLPPSEPPPQPREMSLPPPRAPLRTSRNGWIWWL